MTSITHHIPDALLAAYAAGSLPHAFEVATAAHISLCPTCRAGYEAHNHAGGLVMCDAAPQAISDGMRDRLFAELDAPFEPERRPQPSGIFPGSIIEQMKNGKPRWKPLGGGVKQDILSEGPGGSVRLLFIPPGQAVPDHGHGGLELTLVLQGSFFDETGSFGVGDVEVADVSLEHTPVAGPGEPCICLAATDAPLKFNSFLPRLLQPLFRI